VWYWGIIPRSCFREESRAVHWPLASCPFRPPSTFWSQFFLWTSRLLGVASDTRRGALISTTQAMLSDMCTQNGQRRLKTQNCISSRSDNLFANIQCPVNISLKTKWREDHLKIFPQTWLAIRGSDLTIVVSGQMRRRGHPHIARVAQCARIAIRHPDPQKHTISKDFSKSRSTVSQLSMVNFQFPQ